MIGQRDLRVERRAQRLLRAAERDEHRIAGASEIVPCVSGACVAQQRAMLFEHRAVTVGAELGQLLRRTLDVGEQEGDGARGSHGCAPDECGVRAGRRRRMRSVKHAGRESRPFRRPEPQRGRCYTPAPAGGARRAAFHGQARPAIPRSPRPRPHHRRGRRRPERHRDVLAGRRAVRPRDAVERVPDHAADGRHPGRQRAHRPRHRPRHRAQPARSLSAAAAVVRGLAAARRQHDQRRRRHRRDGPGAAARRRRPLAGVRRDVRRRSRCSCSSSSRTDISRRC